MNYSKCCALVNCIPFFLFSLCISAQANPKILVSNNNVIKRYSFEGEYINEQIIPENNGEVARDIFMIEKYGTVVFNGTFHPILSIYNNGNWSSKTVDGWSTINNGSYGGITSKDDFVFVTDCATAQGGEAKGIIRFDMSGTVSDSRFFDNNDYIDITLGLDNKLCALRNSYGDVDIIDPQTMSIITSLDLGHTSSSRAVVADSDGNIYMASWDGSLYKYDANGNLLSSIELSNNLYDIDIEPTGNLLISDRFGNVFTTDTALSQPQSYSLSSTGSFVAFECMKKPDLLVSNNNVLTRYSFTGQYIDEQIIPENNGEVARDIFMTENYGTVVFNGTFHPILSIYNNDNWSSKTVDGWSTINNGSYGGIAAKDDFVFVTDCATAQGGEAKGIVRFDMSGNTSDSRFFDNNDYIDITLGLDNKLYALRNSYGALDIIDPQTMSIITSLDLGHTSSSRAVVADGGGNIYMASWDGILYKYDANGNLLSSIELSSNLYDIDIESTGFLVVSDRFGNVFTTDTALSQSQSYSLFSNGSFVAFEREINTPEIEYCSSYGKSTYYEWIQAISLDNQRIESGNNNGYQSDETTIFNLNKEHTYVLTLEPGYHFNFAYSEYWSVWIDYNHNGEFSTNELVYSNNGYWNRTGHIEILSGTMEGETKMRISMKYGSYPSSCEVFTWGEVEDYKVQIIP